MPGRAACAEPPNKRARTESGEDAAATEAESLGDRYFMESACAGLTAPESGTMALSPQGSPGPAAGLEPSTVATEAQPARCAATEDVLHSEDMLRIILGHLTFQASLQPQAAFALLPAST